ncbi:MAG: class I SAM-dependent methyltransferase [Elusimicrobia bacterium]|nr:class I SAM-dependent methyltransferase [Elusimicrobiota bacterium]
MPSSNLLERVACPVCGNDRDFIPVHGSRTDNWIRTLDVGLARSRWGICAGCGLVMQNPRPNAEAYKRLYEGSVYHESQLSGDQIKRSLELIEYCFADKIGFAERFYRGRDLAPWRMLDIGCGMGESLAAFRDRKFEVAGVQPDPALTRLAKEHLGFDLRQEYFTGDSFPPNHFSVVFTNHAFEHFDDPASVIAGIAKVLKPGGVCFTCAPTYARNKTPTARAWMNSAHNWIWTHETLGALFKIHGLRPVAHTYNGTPKYTDELWLVVEKPVSGLEVQSVEAAIRGLTPAAQVKRTLEWVVPVRSAIYLPWSVFQKGKRFVQFTGGRPGAVAAYLLQVARNRGGQVSRWFHSLRRAKQAKPL